MQKIALKLISMHRKSILYFILFTFTMLAHTKAQQNYTLYNMNSISQSIYCNPSVFPVNNVNIGLPGLSSNYIGATNTAFRYHDLIYKRPGLFNIKAFDVVGIKLELFNRYRVFLNQEESSKPNNKAFIQTIKPFLIFYKELPEYAKKTTRLKSKTLSLIGVYKAPA